MNESNCSKLPKGWTREEVPRKKGVNKGKIDIYIYSPKGKIFRSKRELSSYIEKNKLPLVIDDFNFSIKRKNMSSESSLSDKASVEEDTTDSVISTNTSLGISEKYGKEVLQPQHITLSTQTDVNYFSIMTTNELISRQWLTDSTLRQYFDVINDRFLQYKAGLILNPVIVQGLKCVNDFDHVTDTLNKDIQILICSC